MAQSRVWGVWGRVAGVAAERHGGRADCDVLAVAAPIPQPVDLCSCRCLLPPKHLPCSLDHAAGSCTPRAQAEGLYTSAAGIR